MAMSAAARRAAQRQLAKDLRAGKQILPPAVTSKAKRAVSERKSEIVNRVVRAKELLHGSSEKFNSAESRKRVTHDKQGNLRSVDDIRKLDRIFTRAVEDEDYDFYEDLVDIDMDDADFYH